MGLSAHRLLVGVGVCHLLSDFPLWMRPALSMSMRCDSQAAIAKDKSKMFNEKNMHISLRHNIMRQLLKTWVISLDFVFNEKNMHISLRHNIM